MANPPPLRHRTPPSPSTTNALLPSPFFPFPEPVEAQNASASSLFFSTPGSKSRNQRRRHPFLLFLSPLFRVGKRRLLPLSFPLGPGQRVRISFFPFSRGGQSISFPPLFSLNRLGALPSFLSECELLELASFPPPLSAAVQALFSPLDSEKKVKVLSLFSILFFGSVKLRREYSWLLLFSASFSPLFRGFREKKGPLFLLCVEH